MMADMQSVVPVPDVAPTPPAKPAASATPQKMARPSVSLLNSFVVNVMWTPPADLHSRRTQTLANLTGSQRMGPARAPPDFPVLGYRLRYRAWEQGDDASSECCLDSVVLRDSWGFLEQSAQLPWLRHGMEYVFEVMAYNAAGDGVWSDPSDVFSMPTGHEQVALLTTDAGEPLPSPSAAPPDALRKGERSAGPTYISSFADRIQVKWPAPCNRGSEILYYDLEYGTDPSFAGSDTRMLKADGTAETHIIDQLAPNMVYYFRHRAYNRQGASPWSKVSPGIVTSATAPERPAPPARLGEKLAPGEIHLKWEPPDSSVPVTHYAVRGSMSESMDNPFDIPMGGEGGPRSPQMRRPGYTKDSFALTQQKVCGLDPATVYYFQVKAINQVATSPWSQPSAPIRTMTLPPRPCGAPELVEGRVRSGMRLRWRPPPGPGEPASQYNVVVSESAQMTNAISVDSVEMVGSHEDERGPWVEGIVRPEQVTFLTGVKYYFCVRGANSAGLGEYSVTSAALMVSPEVPARPEAPGPFESMPGSIVVRWRAPDCQGSPITGYRLRYCTNQNLVDPSEVSGIHGAPLHHMVSHMKPNQTYFFQVMAVNAVGESDWSPAARTVLNVDAPSKMGKPHMIATSSTSITVGFTPPVDMGARNANVVRHYCIRYLEEGASEDNPAKTEEGSPEMATPSGEISDAKPDGCVVSGLKPGVVYAFWVVASNMSGEGDPSDLGHFSTDGGVPDRPKAPVFLADDASSWSLGFQIAPTKGNGSPVTHYAMQVHDTLDDKIWETERWEATPSPEDGMLYHTVLRLAAGIDYSFRVLAKNAVGESEWSDAATGCRCRPRRPEPVVLTLTDVKPYECSVAWEAPHHNGTPITEYVLQCSKDDQFRAGKLEERTLTENKARIEDLTPGMSYYLRAAATNSEGVGKFGESIEVKTECAEPEDPRRIVFSKLGHIHARVDWIIPYASGDPITGYRLRWEETDTDDRPDSERDRGEIVVQGQRRSFMLEPLLAGREYVVQARARNSVGWGPWSLPSPPARLKPALLPTAPGEPTLVSTELEALTVRWDASDCIGADVDQQVIQASTDPSFPEGKVMEMLLPAWSLENASLPPLKKGPYELSNQDLDQEPPEKPSPDLGATPSTALPSPAQTAGAEGALAGVGDWPDDRERLHDRRPIGCWPLALEKLPESRWVRVLGYTKWYDHTFPNLSPGTNYYFRVASRSTPDRSEANQGPYGPVSVAMATSSKRPDVPEACGLGTSMFAAVVGWKRPLCWGAPITHYVVRYADTPEGLAAEDCAAIEQVEIRRESWEGIDAPRALPARPESEALAAACGTAGSREATLSRFVHWLLVRYSSLEQVWEFIDVSHVGRVDLDVFINGNPLIGPPALDGLEENFLREVWSHLGPNEDGKVSFEHMARLQPMADRLLSGEAGEFPFAVPEGFGHDGPFCVIQNLLPGKKYFAKVCAVNAEGQSEWSAGPLEALKTLAAPPERMEPVQGMSESSDSVVLSWKLPRDSGSPITRVEIRWLYYDVGLQPPEEHTVSNTGNIIEVVIDPSTGALPEARVLTGFEPGQTVAACARAFNECGGGWRFSALSIHDLGEFLPWKHPCSTAPLPPDTPEVPTFIESTLSSANFRSFGDLKFQVNRNNGPPFRSFGFELIDCLGDPRYLAHNLFVHVVAGKGLRGKEGLFADAFCTVSVLGLEEPNPIVTKTIYNNDRPQWDHREPLKDWQHGQTIELVVWNQEFGEPPWQLGRAILTGEQLESNFSAELKLELSEASIAEACPDEAFLFLNVEVEAYEPERKVFRAWETEAPEGDGFAAVIGKKDVVRAVPGLLPGEWYQLRARAITEAGPSEWSEPSRPCKMPPDVPDKPSALLSEYTSVTWIELMWKPPSGNGEDKLQYEIAMFPQEDSPEEEWIVIDAETVAAGAKKLAAKGRIGNLTYRVLDQKPGRPMFFTHRARNVVGWSEWAETSRFVTRATRPSKPLPGSMQLTDLDGRSLRLDWMEPSTNGSEVSRYDVVGGPSMRALRWAQIATLIIERSMDADKLFNVNSFGGGFGGLGYGDVVGSEDFGKLRCDECMYAPQMGDVRTMELHGLLPGNTYYFMFRGVCKEGKGDFSDLCAATMRACLPEKGLPPVVSSIESGVTTPTEATIWFTLPYANGGRIDSVKIDCDWITGPLSDKEIDPGTGQILSAVAKLSWQRPIEECNAPFSQVGEDLSHVMTNGGFVRGTTQAVLAAYRDEDIQDPAYAHKDGHEISFDVATSKVCSFVLTGLQPGSEYSVRLTYHNSVGWSPTTEGVSFLTESLPPDQPEQIRCSYA